MVITLRFLINYWIGYFAVNKLNKEYINIVLYVFENLSNIL